MSCVGYPHSQLIVIRGFQKDLTGSTGNRCYRGAGRNAGPAKKDHDNATPADKSKTPPITDRIRVREETRILLFVPAGFGTRSLVSLSQNSISVFVEVCFSMTSSPLEAGWTGNVKR